MANKNAPNGLRAIKHLVSGQYNGSSNKYVGLASDATATFIGDIVKLGAGADSVGVSQALAITTPATDVPVGVVVGFAFDPTNLNIRYRVASTLKYMYVVDDPSVIFEVQDSGTTATTDVGLNANPTLATAGSTVTGVSGMQLDATTKASTNTLMFKILRVVQRPDVTLGANGRFEVMFNRHQMVTGATGV